MKILDLYEHLKVIVENLVELTEDKTNFSQAKVLYSAYTIKKIATHLLQILSKDRDALLTAEHVALLEIHFKDYFNIVKNTELVALCDHHSTLTRFHLALSQQLEDVTKKSRYQYLLPEVSVVEYDASGMNLCDRSVQLTEIVLSDDNTHVIEVLQCLEWAALDGVLRHTRLFEGKSKILSETEAARVIHHSKEAEACWDAIQLKLDVVLRGDSFGAVLEDFAKGLRSGGVKAKKYSKDTATKRNVEFNAQEEAYDAIMTFFEWFNRLSQQEATMLRDCRRKDVTFSLGNLLDLLRTPSESLPQTIEVLPRPALATSVMSDGNATLPQLPSYKCVDLIGDHIQKMVKENSFLYDTYPQTTHPDNVLPKSIEVLETQVSLAFAQLKKALNGPSYAVSYTYPDSEKLFLNRFAVIPDLGSYLKEKFKYYFKSVDDIKHFLNAIDEKNRFNFLLQLVPAINAMPIKVWHNAWYQLEADGLEDILYFVTNAEQQMQLTEQLATKITSVIHHLDDLKAVFESYLPQEAMRLSVALFKANPDLFKADLAKMRFIIERVGDGFFERVGLNPEDYPPIKSTQTKWYAFLRTTVTTTASAGPTPSP